MGSVKRTDVQELSDTVEWDNQKIGCAWGVSLTLALWAFTANGGWPWLWQLLFGEGRGY